MAKKEDSIIKILSQRDLDEIVAAIAKFNDQEEHRMDEDSLEVVIYSNGKIKIRADFSARLEQELDL